MSKDTCKKVVQRDDTLVVKLEWTIERRVDTCLDIVIVILRVR